MLLTSVNSGFWVDSVINVIGTVVFLVSLAVELWAFVHCAFQRSEAFAALGTLSKGMWLLLIGGMLLLSFVFSFVFGGLFGLISLTAALIYLLDVRPAIKDLLSGS